MSSSTSCLNFRSFIDSLREDDDLAEIDEIVDPYLEVGAITRKALEARKRAPLFNNVKGASSGLFRILGAPGGLRKPGANESGRVALHLGLSIDSTPRDIINKSIAVRETTGIKPRVVLTGPCKENMIFGDDIDLEKLPVPFLHRGDGGKYLQTYGLNCIQTPDGTWTNWSINRAMVCGKNAMTGLLVTSQHVNQIYQMYKRKGQDAPWALVLGAPPAAVYVGSMPLPDHANEVDYAGAVAGSPVEVVKCETNDLLVPANAEIVLEGYISTSESAEEGPFTEMYGYVFADEVRKAEVFHVQAITYRNDAILPICPAGRFPDEAHTILGPAFSAEMLRLLQQRNFPVLEAWFPLETQLAWTVIQIDTTNLSKLRTDSQAFCQSIGDFIFDSRPGLLTTTIILVGPDIDIYQFQDVIWAHSTRCHPRRDVYYFDRVRASPLVPFMSRGDVDPFHGGKALLDCLFPVEYEGRADWITGDFEHSYPSEVKRNVQKILAAMD